MVAQIKPRIGPAPDIKSPDSVQSALRKGQNIQRATAAISGLADSARASFQAMEQDEASTNMSLEWTDWYTQINEKPIVNAEEAREMGYDGPNLLDLEGNDREDVELWEILPDISKSKYDELTEKYGGGISGFGKRQEWKNTRKEAGARIYSEMETVRNEQFWQQKVEKHDDSYKRAVELGDYNLAVTLAQTHPVPEKRKELEEQAKKSGFTDSFQRAIQTGNPQIMEEQAEWIREGGADGVLTESEQTKWIQQLENNAVRYTEQANTQRSFEQDLARANLEVAIENGLAGPADIEAFAQQAYADGMPMPKTWMGTQLKKYNEIYQEQVKTMQMVQLATQAANGAAVVDPTDSDQVNGVNTLATMIMSGSDMYGDLSNEQRISRVVDLATKTNVLPKPLAMILRAPANDAIAPEQLVASANAYYELASKKSSLIEQVPAEAKLMMAFAYNNTTSGILTPDSIKEYRAQMQNVSPQMRQARKKRLGDERTNGNVEAKFMGFMDDDPTYDTWDQFEAIPSERMYADFNHRLDYYTTFAGLTDDVYEAAWNDVSSAYGVTEVGGDRRAMKFPPEQVYGIDATTLDKDVKAFIKENFDYVPEDIQLQAHSTTHFMAQPTYNVMARDPDTGLMMIQFDEESGLPMMWKPNLERISKASLEEMRESRKRYEQYGDYRTIPSGSDMEVDMQQQEQVTEGRTAQELGVIKDAT